MKQILLPIIGILLFTSACAHRYAQVYTVTSKQKNITNKNNHLVFEDETLKIEYSFWGRNGLLKFTLTNKSDKPIYVDWKKCAFICNGDKQDYYTETSVTQVTPVGSKDHYGEMSSSVGITSKEARVSFVPPASSISKTSYVISKHYVRLGKDSAIKKALHHNKVNDQEKDEESGGISFRNYITYSYSEDMTNEKSVDNTFYVSHVETMTVNKFIGKNITNDGNEAHSDYQSPDKFYHISLRDADIIR